MVEEIRAIGIKDKADGIAAIWKVTFALNNHEAGTVPLYVDGRGVSFGLKETDDLATVRNNAMAAFNALFDGSPLKLQRELQTERWSLLITTRERSETPSI